ncbi:hypothetical protein Desor_2738 [Desulfosporosinus orientis DSM 765]|uniref:Uncharacterized protein n=1 Tax=Desulfosporosinus orientis (strain ATCC 19365 / DSM 765 / NCIMB 8382 / VKM B-1628 / Singapore I) TaxID=768706 RepID=G7WBF0_DESOD|nr:hypothetical protein [Desulfosporosinus orientis]AET68279.1 hypothetical protein Desor_2738 [Desulfosporosinus orientis DSM 765]
MEILSGLARMLIGWPGIITAIVLVSFGIYSKRIWLIILGTIFTLPISWYLGSTPKFRYIMYALPIFFVGSALAIKLGKNILAWILTLPYVGVVVWLGFTVVFQ